MEIAPDAKLRTRLPRLTDRLTLGGSALQVSPFCVGAVGSPAVTRAAFEAGINFFFVSSDMHWPMSAGSRDGLADLLASKPGMREQIVVAGVCYQTQPEFCQMPFNELIDAVPGLGHLDVLVAGGAYGYEIERRLKVYQRHREGKFVGMKAIGISFHDRKAAAQHVVQDSADIAFVRYNAAHPGAHRDFFPVLAQTPHRSTVFNFNSTQGIPPRAAMEAVGMNESENWLPSPVDAYRLALTEPTLDGVLVSLRSEEQVTALAAAMEAGPLAREEIAYLLELGSTINDPTGA